MSQSYLRRLKERITEIPTILNYKKRELAALRNEREVLLEKLSRNNEKIKKTQEEINEHTLLREEYSNKLQALQERERRAEITRDDSGGSINFTNSIPELLIINGKKLPCRSHSEVLGSICRTVGADAIRNNKIIKCFELNPETEKTKFIKFRDLDICFTGMCANTFVPKIVGLLEHFNLDFFLRIKLQNGDIVEFS
jgi:hypothetical protein